MATGAGYAQKSSAIRAERQAAAGMVHLGANPELFTESEGLVTARQLMGPPLPSVTATGSPWTPGVHNWYHAFRQSPQALLLRTPIEWQFLFTTLTVLNQYYETGSSVLFTRFVQAVSKFGVTPQDRRQLRVRIDSPESQVPDAVAEAEADETEELLLSYEAAVEQALM